MKKLINAQIPNEIILADFTPDKNKPSVLHMKGNHVDFTNDALRAVFDWFKNNMVYNDEIGKQEKTGYYITYENEPYILKMIRKEDVQND